MSCWVSHDIYVPVALLVKGVIQAVLRRVTIVLLGKGTVRGCSLFWMCSEVRFIVDNDIDADNTDEL